MNQYLKTTIAAFVGGIIGALLIYQLTNDEQQLKINESAFQTPVSNVALENYSESNSKALNSIPDLDFVEASKNSRESVVYI